MIGFGVTDLRGISNMSYPYLSCIANNIWDQGKIVLPEYLLYLNANLVLQTAMLEIKIQRSWSFIFFLPPVVWWLRYYIFVCLICIFKEFHSFNIPKKFFLLKLILKVAFLCSEVEGKAFGLGDDNSGIWWYAKQLILFLIFFLNEV